MPEMNPHAVKVHYNARPMNGVMSVTSTVFCTDQGLDNMLERLNAGKLICLPGIDTETYVPAHAVTLIEVRRNAR